MDDTRSFLEHHGIEAESLASSPIGEWPGVASFSPNETAIVGLDQWLYLYRGSNEYYSFYNLESDEARSVTSRWLEFFSQCAERCAGMGCKFVSTIVPNKSTVLFENYPLPLDRKITPVLERILAARRTGEYTMCDLSRYRRDAKLIYRRNDTHPTLFGSYVILENLMPALGVSFEDVARPSRDLKRIPHAGDLGNKFAPDVEEIVTRCDISGGLHCQIADLVKPSSGHVGLSFASRCEDARDKRRVMVFGNSYFAEPVGWGLSPIFTRIFREVSFDWSSTVDLAKIRSFKPDIVVFQTCERFLRRPAVLQG